MGALYSLGDDGKLHRRASQALPPEAESLVSFAIGTGSVGQSSRLQNPWLSFPGSDWTISPRSDPSFACRWQPLSAGRLPDACGFHKGRRHDD